MTAGIQSPAPFRRTFVESAAELEAAVSELAEHSHLGVDLEMAQRVQRKPGGLQEWHHVLALIQLAAGDLSVVIDPLRCTDLSPLRPLMWGNTRKIFLGGGQDAALLERAGIPANNIVDVGEIALAIFGRRQDGMAALAHRIFGISLDKTVRRTDWLARPLNPVLIAYAHRDAELTLLIYRWLVEQYPDIVGYHEREEFEPRLPRGTARWLLEILSRPGQDPIAILMEHGIDARASGSQLAGDLRMALLKSTAPRQTNRLLRLAGDLGVTEMLPDVAVYVASPSSMLRATSARVIGQLAAAEEGVPLVEPLLEDPLEEVRKTAEGSIREMHTPQVEPEERAPDEEVAQSLGESAMAALQKLRAQMDGDT